MGIREINAHKFEEWIRHEVLKRDLTEAEGTGICTLEIDCPCCTIGQLTIYVNLKHMNVIAACDQFGLEGQCETHKVSMPLNMFKRTRTFDSDPF